MEDERCIEAAVVLAEADRVVTAQYASVVAAVGQLCGVDSTAFDRFQASVVLGKFVEAAQAKALADLADENSLGDVDDFDMDRERWIRLGADGTDPISEALPAEIAVSLGVSLTTASWLLRDVVELRARHPWTWGAVQDGRIPLWRARQVVQVCARYELSLGEARRVDRRLDLVLGKVGWRRVLHMLQAVIMQVAPDKVEELSVKAKASRYCRRVDSPDVGTSYLEACLDTADALSFDQAVDQLAEVLRLQGDDTDRDHRRSRAVGILGVPSQAAAMLAGHEADTPAVAQVYVHLSAETLRARGGVVRVERLGPAMVSQLGQILGHRRIRLTPVVNIGDTELAVDAYEVPRSMRAKVILRDRFEPFPWSNREARGLDADHTIPFRPGVPGQTRPSNLGPLSRRIHRIKTHCGWKLTQISSGVFEWTTTYGQRFIVGPGGTTRYYDRQ